MLVLEVRPVSGEYTMTYVHASTKDFTSWDVAPRERKEGEAFIGKNDCW